MRQLTATIAPSLSLFFASSAFAADPCGDAICSLTGHAGSYLGMGGIVGLLLAVGAAAFGTWLYRRRDRISSSTAGKENHNVGA